LASPETWLKVIGDQLEPRTEGRIQSSIERYIKLENYEQKHGGDGWSVDQQLLFDALENQTEVSVIRVFDFESKHKRLDRESHRFPLNFIVLPCVAFGAFTDYHVHHPVSRTRNRVFLILLLWLHKHLNQS
jgi:hypothetical protein